MAVNFLKNERGIALFEMLPLLVVFTTLVGLTVGLWGAVHSGVLQSIAARHYAFEVINNRPHFEYHRDFELGITSSSPLIYNSSKFAKKGDYHGNTQARLFIIKADASVPDKEPYVTHRGINFFEEIKRGYDEDPKGIIPVQKSTLSPSFHKNSIKGGLDPVNPLWIMVGYGICLNCYCGDGDAKTCR